MTTETSACKTILVYDPTGEADRVCVALSDARGVDPAYQVSILTDFAPFIRQFHDQMSDLYIVFCLDNTTLSAFREQITAGMTVPRLIIFDPQHTSPEAIITLDNTDYLVHPTTPVLLRHRVDAIITARTPNTVDDNARLAHELESAFRDYYTRTESIINAMTEVVLVLNAEGRYVDVITRNNPLLIQPASDLMGKYLSDVMPANLSDEMLQVIRTTLKTRTTQNYEHPLTIEDKQRWFRANVTPINESDVLWVVTDITDIKYTRSALSDASERYETLFRFANDAIFMIEMDTGKILEANRQASRLLGYTTAELCRMSMEEIEARLDELSTNHDLDITVQSPSQMILEQFYRHKDGQIIPVETSNRIIEQEDSNAIIICFARDIRERKYALRAEREQRLLAEALRDTATVINRTLERDTLYELIVEHAYNLLRKCSVNITTLGEKLAHIVYHKGYEPYMDTKKIDGLAFETERAVGLRQAINQKRPNMVADTRQEKDWLQVKGMEWIRSQMSIPIVVENEVVAIINTDSPYVGYFTPQDRDRIQALSEQASIALHNVQLFERIQKQTQNLELAIANRTRALSDANTALKKQIIERTRIEEQLEQVLNSARCLLWSATVRKGDNDRYQWDFVVANEDAAQKLLPLDTSQQTYSEAWGDSILPQDRRRRFYVLRTHMKFGKYTVKQELRCRDVDGKLLWLIEDILIKPLDDGVWYLAGVCTDITDLKTAETALQQANVELERRVQQRTEELTRINATLSQEIVERKRAEESERQQRLLAEALRDSGALLIENLDGDSVLEYLLDTLTGVIPHDASHIGLLDGDFMTVVKQRGYPPTFQPPVIDISQWQDMQEIITKGTYYIINDRSAFHEWAGVEGDEWVNSNLSIPVILDDEVIGVLKLESRHKNHFNHKQAEWLQAFANQAGVALRNARLVEKIRTYTEELEQRVEERTGELVEERAQLQAILDAMRDGVYYQDVHGDLQYTNSALTTITGYTAHEWRDHVGLDTITITSDEDNDNTARQMHHHMEAVGFWQGEIRIRHKNDAIIHVNITHTTVYDDQRQRLGVVTVVRDINQEKALAAQKARFIASASHELRTPIANLKTRLFLMERAPDKFTDHIAVAREVVNWMQHLVEDMFDLSRFERGVIELDFETVQLQKFINDIVTFQQPEAERKLINLLTEMPTETIHYDLDPYRMTQVITNLVTNAIHYTSEGGHVKIDLDVEDANITLRVTDTGGGIAPEHLAHLFQPFYRANINSKGAGLGLSISKEIVELHGGTIEVISQVGEGSQFLINLPRQGATERT